MSAPTATPAATQRRTSRSCVVEDIHTFYGSIEALKGISLEVNEGEIVTLIGANGAGKSTTLRSISGIVPPRTGRIVFDGARDPGPARPQGRRDRHRAVARGPADLPAHDGAREPRDGRVHPARREGHPRGPRARLRAVPAPEGARAPEGRHDVRRRAADARDRPRADGPAEAAAARRAVARPGAGDRRHASTRSSARSTRRARRSCSSSRTPTTRSTSRAAATCSRPATSCSPTRPRTCATTSASKPRTWGPDMTHAFVLAAVGAKAFYLLMIWLASAIAASGAVQAQGLRREVGPRHRPAAELRRRDHLGRRPAEGRLALAPAPAARAGGEDRVVASRRAPSAQPAARRAAPRRGRGARRRSRARAGGAGRRAGPR